MLLGTAVLGISACESEPEFFVSEMEIRQLSWDSLSVRIKFEESTRLGAPETVSPDSSWSTVFSSSFDTLYHGAESIIVIRDEELEDRETILIETCGTVGSMTACEQRMATASPKKMEAETDLDFPQSEAFDRGTYRFDYRLKRKVFGSESWEYIRRRVRPETYLLAYVENHEADAIRLPVRRTRNRFNLARFGHYRDFRFHIKSRLMDADSASVVFDLYTRLGTDAVKVAENRVVLRQKSEEERRSELAQLVELAGNRILDQLKGFVGLRLAYVFINDWSYRPLEKTYSSEIELHWKSGFRGEWFDMIGHLTVKADGTAGQYEWLQGSTSAERRWFSSMDSTVIFLDALWPDVGLRPRLESDEKESGNP